MISPKKSPKTILTYALSLFVFADICYTMIWALRLDYGAYSINPLVFYLLSFFAFLPILYRFFKQKTPTVNTVVFSGVQQYVMNNSDNWDNSSVFVNEKNPGEYEFILIDI